MSQSMMEKFSNNWEKMKKKRTASFDGTPFRNLSTKEKVFYEEFLEGLKNNNIPYVDTFPEGGSCLMVYPQETMAISCIFSYLCNATIELRVCDAENVDELLDKIIQNESSDFGVYDYEYKLIRSSNIQKVITWINKLNKRTN